MKTIVIKRYMNRKLYNVDLGHYVTIPDIISYIKDGYEIIVIDNRTKEDITRKLLNSCLPFLNLDVTKCIDIIFSNK